MFFSISKRPTIAEIHNLYLQKKATCSDVLKFFINRGQQIDKSVKAFYKFTIEFAEKTAAELDKEMQNSDLEELLTKKPLFGIPFSLKLNIQVEGETMNAGAKILDHFTSAYTSTVAEKLLNSGGILIGLNNMDQFALGSSGETSDYGITKNPFDTTRVAGGSSAGPAACVGAGQVVFSIGTDTGGSIRQPAAFCDVVGIKPTYGLISRSGIMSMASSFDQAGAITNTVLDNLIVTKVLAGKDAYGDQTTLDSGNLVEKLEIFLQDRNKQRKTTKLTKTNRPFTIGLPKEFYIEGIDPIILAKIEEIQDKLQKIGHKLIPVEIPRSKYSLATYYMTMPVELASNLERIDGVRYAPQQEKYEALYTEHRSKYFGEETKRRIMLGTYASSAGYYDAYYNQAQKVRALAKQDFDKVFEQCDLLLTPTTPEFPFKIGQKTADPLKMYLSDVFTCGINPVQIPGLNVPLGLFDVQDENGETVKLPTGCQILGPELSEDKIYRLAEEIEKLV